MSHDEHIYGAAVVLQTSQWRVARPPNSSGGPLLPGPVPQLL